MKPAKTGWAICNYSKFLFQIDWLKFLRHNFTTVTDGTQVLITSKEYFGNLSLLIRSTDKGFVSRI